jgi:hypothetical protein
VTCDEHVQRALRLTTELLDLANEEREDCHHDHCLLLDGIVRDCAMEIRKQALQSVLELTDESERERSGRSDVDDAVSPAHAVGISPPKRA